jgi:hypothetical protein
LVGLGTGKGGEGVGFSFIIICGFVAFGVFRTNFEEVLGFGGEVGEGDGVGSC